MIVHDLNDMPNIKAYLERIGAEPRTLRTAVVKEKSGTYWKDIATIHFNTSTGEISTSNPKYAPIATEADRVKADILSATFPKLQLQMRGVDYPDEIKNADPKNVFEFRNETGQLIMLQLRRDFAPGEKAYIPYTYWDDGEWRKLEPEGKLPLYNIDKIKDNTTAFIHEGAKAARAAQTMIEQETEDARIAYKNCPWAMEMDGAVHLGWIGGALSPMRTDWALLKRLGIKRVYIVSDNDAPGVAAVPKISHEIHLPTFHVQFTNDWPASFDMADPWPDSMFRQIEGKRNYIGPNFRSCIHPATWATDLVPNGRGRPTPVLRDSFVGQWTYVEESDVYVCTEMPELVRSDQILNKMLAAFSDTADTAKLINRSYQGKFISLCYRPDTTDRFVVNQDRTAINLYVPGMIRSMPGNPKPWIDFLSYLIPIPEERKEMERWCATLIARPETHMEYGCLLASETQGVGKTTLGVRILSKLVGINNTSFPTESAIVESSFNEWAAQKRLIVIDEIYAGQSWKAYNKLKKYITDRLIEVNKKYMRPYTLENWGHIFANSNSMTALKVENEDRRWFYPQITEKQWTRDQFGELHNWLEGGGLSIIKYWAENYGDYVIEGERAPMTKRKAELIAASQSAAVNCATDLSMAMIKYASPVCVGMKEVMEWIKRDTSERIYESELKLRRIMGHMGLIELGRHWVNGRMQYILANSKFRELPDETSDAIKSCISTPEEVTGGARM